MADYTLHFSDPTKSPIILENYFVDGPTAPWNLFPLQHLNYPYKTTPSTTLVLYGKGIAEYGERVQQNILNMLEHFASTNPPVYPVEGQIWYDKNINQIKIYDGSIWKNTIDGSEGGLINGQFIINEPTEDYNAATKKYVDDAIFDINNGYDFGNLHGSYDISTGVLNIALTSTNYVDVVIPSIDSLTINSEFDDNTNNLTITLSNNNTSTVSIPNANKLTISGTYDSINGILTLALSNGDTAVINNLKPNISRHVLVTPGDTSTLTVPEYVMNTNRLWVFRNGIKQILGSAEDYQEMNTTTLLFNTIIPAGTKFELMYL